MRQDLIRIVESRQTWVALGGVAVAVAAALGVPIPGHLEAVVEAVFGAVFLDGTIHKAALTKTPGPAPAPAPGQTAGGAR
jgi:hypothetical protein